VVRYNRGLLYNCIIPMKKLALAAFFLLPVVSQAATKWECGERSNLPIEGRNYCAAGDFRHSEINLGKALDALLEKHKAAFGDASALSKAQSAFESYRDNQCAAENKRIEDKHFHPMVVAQCKTRLTNLRMDELNRMLQKDK
jgi:uncharacterized protein YecT (DUF1311 family)